MDTRLQGALQLSAFVLRNRKVLCVFPEGTRSRDGGLKEFKKGVAIVARELNIPLIPVAIQGTYEVLPPGKAFPGPVRSPSPSGAGLSRGAGSTTRSCRSFRVK